MQKKAAETQGPLLAFLADEANRHQVAFYESYWIDNLIFVTALRPAIEEIAARPDVEMVFLEQEIMFDEPMDEGGFTIELGKMLESEYAVVLNTNATHGSCRAWSVQRGNDFVAIVPLREIMYKPPGMGRLLILPLASPPLYSYQMSENRHKSRAVILTELKFTSPRGQKSLQNTEDTPCVCNTFS